MMMIARVLLYAVVGELVMPANSVHTNQRRRLRSDGNRLRTEKSAGHAARFTRLLALEVGLSSKIEDGRNESAAARKSMFDGPVELFRQTETGGVELQEDSEFWKEIFEGRHHFYVQRLSNHARDSHKDVVYERLTPVPLNVDLADLFLYYWVEHPNNTLGVDFNLYTGIEDALEQRNAWAVCTYNDRKHWGHSSAFPGDCGPLKETPWAWNSMFYKNPLMTEYSFFAHAGGKRSASRPSVVSLSDPVVLFKQTEALGIEVFEDSATWRNAVSKRGKFFIRRLSNHDVASRRDIVYERLTPFPRNVDPITLFLIRWTEHPRNTLGVDFNLYSGLSDALEGRNPWTFCNYCDANGGACGFPRDCGPTGEVRNGTNSLYYWLDGGTEQFVTEYSFLAYYQLAGNDATTEPLHGDPTAPSRSLFTQSPSSSSPPTNPIVRPIRDAAIVARPSSEPSSEPTNNATASPTDAHTLPAFDASSSTLSRTISYASPTSRHDAETTTSTPAASSVAHPTVSPHDVEDDEQMTMEQRPTFDEMVDEDANEESETNQDAPDSATRRRRKRRRRGGRKSKKNKRSYRNRNVVKSERKIAKKRRRGKSHRNE